MRKPASMAFILVVSSVTASWADGFCAQLDSLMAETLEVDAPVTFDLGGTDNQPVQCTRALGLEGAMSLHCARAFDYRSASATATFDSVLQQVASCAVAIDNDDQPVSHPDSYDLRQFQLGTGTVSVSLKDKASLAQSFVFLRVARPRTP